jgi:hypothetical protein
VIRLARQDDAAAISALVDAAFVIYVPRTGGKPLAMLDDYPALISQGAVHILEHVACPCRRVREVSSLIPATYAAVQ